MSRNRSVRPAGVLEMKLFHRGQILCTESVPGRCWIVLAAGVFAAAFVVGDAQPGTSAGENEPAVAPQNQTGKPRRHRPPTPSAEQLQHDVEEAEEAEDEGPGGLAQEAEFETVTLTDGSKVKVKKWGETYLGYDFRPPVNADDQSSSEKNQSRQRVRRANGHGRRNRMRASNDDGRPAPVRNANGGVETVVDRTGGSVRAMCLDVEHNHIYWIGSGPARAAGHIGRATLDGQQVETIVNHVDQNAWGLAIDPKHGTLYWGVSPYPADRRIQRARLDGSNVQDVVVGLAGPLGIAVDGDEGRIYFTDKRGGGPKRIFSARLDGTDRKLIADGEGGLKLVFDRADRKLYWMAENSDRIYRSNINGTNIENPINLGKGDNLFGTSNDDRRGEFWGMDVDSQAGFIYWFDRAAGNIRRANLDGSHVEEIVCGIRNFAGRCLAVDAGHGFLYWSDSLPGEGARIRRVKIPDRLKPTRKKSPPIIARIERIREGSGEQIRLIGEGFRGATQVTFLGVGTGESVVAKFDVASDQKIDVAIPQFRTEARQAAITVQTPGGVTVTLPKDPLVLNLKSWHTRFDAWAADQRFTVVVQPIARGVGFERAIVYVASGGAAHSGPEGMNTLFLKNGATVGVSIMPRSTVYFEPFAMVTSRNKVREDTRLIAVPAIRPSFVDALFEVPKKDN
jgi:hypothetical protein